MLTQSQISDFTRGAPPAPPLPARRGPVHGEPACRGLVYGGPTCGGQEYGFPARRSGRRGGRGRRPAFTLVELLVALTITVVIGAAVASMLFTTARATETRTDVRRAVVHSQQLDARLRAKVLSAGAFLGTDATHLLLWLRDDNDNQLVNLGELGLLEFDTGTKQLRFYAAVWPAGWSQAQIATANVTYSTGTNYLQQALAARGAAYFPQQVWSRQVGALSITLDKADPLLARLATLRMTMAVGDLAEPLIVAAALRAPQTVGGS
ncbi:MAG TPA: prepilin-type N-terminal cleavage/methylation domain-containing protein [Phycisphaerae bacterium]|nr:prepilin-type N-terminal cleavage/methylation domain-containing protein [Phycisphaerae bacterium]